MKVVVDKDNFALAFSRLPIPFYRDDAALLSASISGHVGLYVFSRQCLLKNSRAQPDSSGNEWNARTVEKHLKTAFQ